MIRCPTCQTPNLPGAFFCGECGASFLPAQHRDTTASLGAMLATPPAQPITPPPPPIERVQPALRLVILNSGRKLAFGQDKPIAIGRPDTARGTYPDLDLSVDGGLDAGVSRHHARLYCQGAAWWIEDLGSANGTFVNRQPVQPQAPVNVNNGDELRLGNILIRIELSN